MNPPTLRYYQPEKAERKGLLDTDICIYGATAGGISAALQAHRSGKKVVLLEPEGHVGGMTASGLSLTDSGIKDSIGGLARDFYRECGEHYGAEEEWKFEPHVATGVFLGWLREAGIEVHFHQYLAHAVKEEGMLTEIVLESGLRVRARMFLDCTYEGDLMAAAGVSYAVGRESNDLHGETYNGVQIAKNHQFNLRVDPYVIPGDPSSGLLPGIEAGSLADEGTGDHRVQAYNFRLCLTRNPQNRIPFAQPEGYDEREYELLARYYEAGWKDELRKFDPIRGEKVDMNNYGGISSDFIGRNFAWPEATYAEREVMFQEHVRYQQGLLWFRANDARVPRQTREAVARWGLAADEFTETGGWPPRLYVREARRMKSDLVMTDRHCFGHDIVDDPIGMASYTLDSHNCRRFVQDGCVLNEGNVEVRVSPFPIGWRSIRPRREEVGNLLVPVCLSASHIAFGSIRMEPVFMILGQSAAIAACLALDSRCAVQELPYPAIREELLRHGQVLECLALQQVG